MREKHGGLFADIDGNLKLNRISFWDREITVAVAARIELEHHTAIPVGPTIIFGGYIDTNGYFVELGVIRVVDDGWPVPLPDPDNGDECFCFSESYFADMDPNDLALITLPRVTIRSSRRGGYLSVERETLLENDLDVWGDTSLGGDLYVERDTQLYGSLYVADTVVARDLEVTGHLGASERILVAGEDVATESDVARLDAEDTVLHARIDDAESQATATQHQVTILNSLVVALMAEMDELRNQMAEVEANAIASVLADPDKYGLFTEAQVMDLAVGGMILKPSETQPGSIQFNVSIEGNENLLTDHWETLEVIQQNLPMGEDSRFVRIRVGTPESE